jgi:hypothetical protein
MIDRAELPVQRNNTLNGRSAMAGLMSLDSRMWRRPA